MNDKRKKGSGIDSVLVLILLILFLLGVSFVLEVIWLGIIGSILVLLQYVSYIKTIRRKEMEKIFQEKMIKNDKDLKEFIDNNPDLEGIIFYRYYKDSEESGVMLIYETYYDCLNTNIDKIMREYHDILLKEYGKLNESEIDFVSATGGRAYASFSTSVYGKDYLAIFIISAKSSMEQKELDLKVERLKRDFILRRKL